jgi:hypothetical protein
LPELTNRAQWAWQYGFGSQERFARV